VDTTPGSLVLTMVASAMLAKATTMRLHATFLSIESSTQRFETSSRHACKRDAGLLGSMV
jgi:hypothetical protein